MKRRLAFAAFVAALVAANAAGFRWNAAADLTANRRLSLQPESVRVAQRLPDGVHVRVFLPPQSRLGREAKLLLERYARHARSLTFELVNPDRLRAEALREEVSPGQAIVRRGERRLVVDGTSEQDLTSAFLRVIRPAGRTVCFTSGHGEPAVDDGGPTGVEGMARSLVRAGYEIVGLPPVAQDYGACDALVVVGPQTAFTHPEREAFHAFLRAEGKAMVLADPPAQAVADELVRDWGIRVLPGVVIDPAQSAPEDPLSPVVDRYPSFNPAVATLRSATVWSETAGLEGGGLVPGRGGLYVSTLAETSPASWIETGGGPGFQEGTDRRGPVLVAASADDARVGGRERRVPSTRARVLRTRLVVFGDADIATNVLIDVLANARIVLDSVAWLVQDEELIGLVPKAVSATSLPLTGERERLLLFWSVAFPALGALGAAGAARYRRRR